MWCICTMDTKIKLCRLQENSNPNKLDSDKYYAFFHILNLDYMYVYIHIQREIIYNVTYVM